MTTLRDWDGAYAEGRPSPWDIGRPQPAFVRLADRDLLSGRVLDVGCGTGEQALLAAGRGAQVLGVDISPRAIGRARAKAAERDLAARFEVADALNLAAIGLAAIGLTFDTVIDCGLFHVFDDEARARYVASLASVLDLGGVCYLMCFSDRQPGDFGPRRASQDELRSAFGGGWAIADITADAFELNPGFPLASAQAWLATIRRM